MIQNFYTKGTLQTLHENIDKALEDVRNAEWYDEETMTIMIETPSCAAYVVYNGNTIVKSYGRGEDIDIDNTKEYLKGEEV